MGMAKTCDICQMARQRLDRETMQPVSDVVRYTLRREVDQTRDNGKRTRRYQQSAGGIDLCGECWGRICQPRTNPKKARQPRSMWAA